MLKTKKRSEYRARLAALIKDTVEENAQLYLEVADAAIFSRIVADPASCECVTKFGCECVYLKLG